MGKTWGGLVGGVQLSVHMVHSSTPPNFFKNSSNFIALLDRKVQKHLPISNQTSYDVKNQKYVHIAPCDVYT